MPLPTLLAIAGFACHLTGFLLYFWQIRRGNTKPNMASWTVWLVVTILNLASYGVMTGDLIKMVPIIASALGCLFVTAYAYVKGTRQALGPVEQGIRPMARPGLTGCQLEHSFGDAGICFHQSESTCQKTKIRPTIKVGRFLAANS